ncbi:MAG: hypothetical protein Q9159_004370 [Coniocarpon cinnabarinum]
MAETKESSSSLERVKRFGNSLWDALGCPWFPTLGGKRGIVLVADDTAKGKRETQHIEKVHFENSAKENQGGEEKKGPRELLRKLKVNKMRSSWQKKDQRDVCQLYRDVDMDFDTVEPYWIEERFRRGCPKWKEAIIKHWQTHPPSCCESWKPNDIVAVVLQVGNATLEPSDRQVEGKIHVAWVAFQHSEDCDELSSAVGVFCVMKEQYNKKPLMKRFVFHPEKGRKPLKTFGPVKPLHFEKNPAEKRKRFQGHSGPVTELYAITE